MYTCAGSKYAGNQVSAYLGADTISVEQTSTPTLSPTYVASGQRRRASSTPTSTSPAKTNSRSAQREITRSVVVAERAAPHPAASPSHGQAVRRAQPSCCACCQASSEPVRRAR